MLKVSMWGKIRHHWKLQVGILGLLFLVVGGIVFVSSNVYGAGGGGSSGGSGGCSGYCSSKYGWGWMSYSTSSGGPAGGFENGTSWSHVVNTCSTEGVGTVYVFAISNGSKWKSYNYEAPPSRYGGDQKGIAISTAQGYYNSAVKAGISGGTNLTFGVNVGWFCYSTAWSVSTATSVNQTTAQPGDTITWTHSVTTNGPNLTTKVVTWHYQNRGDWPNTTGTDWTLASGTKKGITSKNTSTYVVQPTDEGTQICRSTSAEPASSSNSGWTESTPACVSIEVTTQFILLPSVQIGGSAVEPGENVQVTPTINNEGDGDSSNSQWQLTTMTYAPGVAVPTYANGDPTGSSVPCTYFATTSAQNCAITNQGKGGVAAGTSNFTKASGDDLIPRPETVGSYPLGTHVCYALSVQAHSTTDPNWIYSAPICVIIVAKPEVQVRGGDLLVGQSAVGDPTLMGATITTSQTKLANGNDIDTYGSWGEYGLFANGLITGMASGAAFNGNSGLANVATACDYSKLSFTSAAQAGATACDDSAIGNYQSAQNIPDVAAAFPVTSSTPVFGDISDAQYKRVEKATGDITIGAATIQKGQWLVINAIGHTVTITGDITYTGDTLSGIGDIPQLVILADNINIAGNVKEVDAWLIATTGAGIVNTCSDVAPGDNLSSQVCSNQLQINGPVAAEFLYLERTYGRGVNGDTNAGDPAETFNLRPDAYLWAMARGLDAQQLSSAGTTELPPRF